MVARGIRFPYIYVQGSTDENDQKDNGSTGVDRGGSRNDSM